MRSLRGRPDMVAYGVLFLVGVVTLAGCGGLAATPLPAVTVHVVNRISNVVVTAIDLHPEGVVGTAPTDGYGFLAPCGGEVELRATIEHADLGGGGMVGLGIDPDGDLDRIYPNGDVEPASAQRFGLAIIYSSGELLEGDWLTITPTDVVRSNAPPPTPASPEDCGPWAYRGD